MSKSDIILKLKEKGLVAVIRGEDYQEGVDCSIACIEAGLDAIEVAYSNSEASAIIKTLLEKYPDAFIGAGTVLDDVTARMAILAGAKYIVSPSFNKDTAVICNRYGIPYIPGCMTLTEIVTAMESGCEIIKLFPGSAFGPSYIKSVKAPLPQVSLMVTGGVNQNNIKEWFDAGACALGIGGELNTYSSLHQFDKVKETAKIYVQKAKEARL